MTQLSSGQKLEAADVNFLASENKQGIVTVASAPPPVLLVMKADTDPAASAACPRGSCKGQT